MWLAGSFKYWENKNSKLIDWSWGTYFMWENINYDQHCTVEPKYCFFFQVEYFLFISFILFWGNIIHQKVEAIVNAANVHLKHGSGVARSIAEAAGRRLVEECVDYLLRNGHALETSEPMHTSAGDLSLPILYVIHVAGPRADDRYQGDLNDSVLRTFENVLTYANNVLQVSSVAIPAISSGN